MSYQEQAGQLVNAFRSAGFSPDAAQKIAAILANGYQHITRTNPETVDLTPPEMRYVTPEARKYQLQELDFRQGDPDYRPYQLQASENRPNAKQASTVRGEPAPQRTAATYRVLGGKLTEAKGTGDAVQVNVKVTGNGRGVLLDQQGNSLVGKNFRCEADDTGLRFYIEETGTELVWKLQLGDFLAYYGTTVEVVTGITLGVNGLEVTKKAIRVLDVADMQPEIISTISCQ